MEKRLLQVSLLPRFLCLIMPWRIFLLQFTTHGWRPDIKLFHHSFKLISSRNIKTFMIRCARCRFLMIWIFYSALNLHVWALCFSRFHEYQNHDFCLKCLYVKYQKNSNTTTFVFSIEWKIRAFLSNQKRFFKVWWMWALKKNDTTKYTIYG